MRLTPIISLGALILFIPFCIFGQAEEIQNTEELYWWVNPLIEGISIIIGALIIIWQMGRQHKDNLALQKQNMKEQLRLEIYKELAAKIDNCNEAIVIVMSTIIGIPANFSLQLCDSHRSFQFP